MNITILLGQQFFKKVFFTKGLLVLLLLFLVTLTYVTLNSWTVFKTHHNSIELHQQQSRNSWESNPDKHPHRMAHFGSFVFRIQHPLCIFDSGIENYTGNSIYLEAHKQNTANFSQAALSTGLVRFGDLNIALLLQLILPLIIFFIGYASVTLEKENGTLKIIYLQGASVKQVLLGKALGLFALSALFFIPAFIALWCISILDKHVINSQIIWRTFLITISYILFFMVLSFVTVIISAASKNANKSLLSLLGAWLLFFIIIPKTAQVVGHYLHPNLSKIEFQEAIETIVAKQGDSHNPNDPYFNAIRDSILKANNVSSTKDLPFNYGGFLMSKGEEQTAKIYKNQHDKLMNTYKNQNNISNFLVWLNPYLAIKNVSMGLSGTDFYPYTHFLLQTEGYRYQQSQYMNKLQMKFINNKAVGSEGKIHVVDKRYWKNVPKFNYKFLTVSTIIKHQVMAFFALCLWLLVSLLIITKFFHRFKII